MKMLYKLSLAAVVLLMISCNESTESTEPKVHHEQKVAVSNEVSEHDEIADELHLHGTEKWAVSEHMVAHILTVDSLLLDYKQTDLSTATDLAIRIDEELVKVTQTCNMTGEAHAQLHLWLLPFWNLVDQFKTVQNEAQGNQLLEEMKASMEVYHTFFK